MPLEIIAGPLAVETLKGNPYATWPPRGHPKSRLEPLARPMFRSGFQLVPGERIFTIGSCFARNIELELELRGFHIPTRAVFREQPDFALLGRNILNNYGVASIFNELNWALDPGCAFPEAQGFFEMYPGKFVDIHLNHSIAPASLEIVRQRRKAIQAVYAQAGASRVIVMTLGLAEVWFDQTAGVYLNATPRRTMVRQDPDRFSLHVLNAQETLDYLDRAMLLLETFGAPDLHVILTVSPVPLTATHRDMDVMTANTYSKAVLRTAAEEITARYAFVDYFPSYESIVLSERGAAWEEDQIHPTAEVVALNCRRMVEAYAAPSPAEDVADDLRQRLASGLSAEGVFGLLEGKDEVIVLHPDLALAFCRAALKVKRPAQARWAFDHIGTGLPDMEVALLGAQVALALERYDEALALLSDPPAPRLLRSQFYAALTQARIGLNDLDGARTAASAWAALSIRSPEPYRLLGVAFSEAGQIEQADLYLQQALDRSDDEPRILLAYAEHLDRSGRRAEAEAFLAHIFPNNPSLASRLERLRLQL